MEGFETNFHNIFWAKLRGLWGGMEGIWGKFVGEGPGSRYFTLKRRYFTLKTLFYTKHTLLYIKILVLCVKKGSIINYLTLHGPFSSVCCP